VPEAQVVSHVPLAVHLYGVQSCVWPFAPVSVWLPSHVGAMRTPQTPASGSHTLPEAQSALTAHEVLQAFVAHAYGLHVEASGTSQWPVPSQLPTGVSAPPAQLAAPHATVDPTNPAHAVCVTPSHSAWAHGFDAVPLAHGSRTP
jgi:hypothetical protein